MTHHTHSGSHLLRARQVLTSPHVRATGDCRMLSVFERLVTLLYSEPAMPAFVSFSVPADAPSASKDSRKQKYQSAAAVVVRFCT